MDRLHPDEVRTGAVYEAARLAERDRLASTAVLRRVALADDLALVFETSASVRMALEELLRSERVDDHDRTAAETAAFAELLGAPGDLAATLYVEVADPVELAERLGELAGVEDAVSIEVAGRRTTSRSDRGDAGSGAFHLLFALDDDQWSALRAGLAGVVRVDHPSCRAVATVSAELARALGADSAR